MFKKWSLWFKTRKTKQYDDIVEIDKIRISKDFRETKPKYWKVVNKTKYIDSNGYSEKPMIISKSNMILTDRHIDYLVCKCLGVKYIPVKWV